MSAEYPSKTLRVSNVVSYVLLIAVNAASNSGLLGPTNADLSEQYSTPLTPSGYVAVMSRTAHQASPLCMCDSVIRRPVDFRLSYSPAVAGGHSPYGV